MNTVSVCVSEGERSLLNMLGKGAILVGDRWFSADSTEIERTRYLLSYQRRLERNRRRRERRRAVAAPFVPRKVRAPIPMDDDAQRIHRLTLERRKCQRRSTIAPCPSPNEIRAAWAFRHATSVGVLRLGGLLLDLECYVDSSLKIVYEGLHAKIVGRSPGIRGWIRENCPELEMKYKSMMRAKSLARSVRQELDIPDPIPTSVLLDTSDPAALADQPLQIQPRGTDESSACELVRDRYVWEHSKVKYDAKGRPYRANENYWLITHDASYCRRVAFRIIEARMRLASIILNGKGKCAIENYVRDAQKGQRLRTVEPRSWRTRRVGPVRIVRERTAGEVIRDAVLAWVDLPYQMTRLHRYVW